MSQSDGMNYAPKGKPNPVVGLGEFQFAVAAMDHGHIHGQVNGLVEAGATLKWVYDKNDPAKAKDMAEKFDATVADSLDQILADDEIKLVAAAAIPNERAPLGIQCMEAGKDYFTDKTPLLTLEQLDAVKETISKTGRKYMVYYSERLHVESAMFATELIEEGAIGKVLSVTGFGPHRHGPAGSRPDWFYNRQQYGGILVDIGSHQLEQFLAYTGAKDGKIVSANVGNFGNPDFPEFEDYGDAMIVGDNGTTFYYQVHWFTPDGSKAWGDGRTFITGTDGYIELRKYINVGTDEGGDTVILVNQKGTQKLNVAGKVGYKYFGALILDCINRTENAMSQDHALKAAELCVRCQMAANNLTPATLTG